MKVSDTYEIQCKNELELQIKASLKKHFSKTYKIDSLIIRDFIELFNDSIRKAHKANKDFNYSSLINVDIINLINTLNDNFVDELLFLSRKKVVKYKKVKE